MEQMRGKIGDLVFRRYEGRVVVARKPDRDGLPTTEGQANARLRFRQAAAYGKEVFADPDKKALYSARGKSLGKPSFAVAVSDFLRPPAIDYIDLSGYTGQIGQTITVRASDDFLVAGVTVTVKDDNGTTVEEGAARLEQGVWRYTTTATLPMGRPATVEVVATDLPGHPTRESKVLP